MNLDEVSKIFSALSQENRLKVFRILIENSVLGITPTQISILMNDMPRNTLSFHLNTLNQAGLCSFEKQGKQMIYKPNCKIIKNIASFLLKDCCDGDCKC